MISNKKLANAMSGKTARACDCCIRKRARWYCAADDAFLCQVCDGSVHSANPLARRHERVRLQTGSIKPRSDPVDLPSWNRGSTRKARTPRHGKHSTGKSEGQLNPLSVVPQLGEEDTTSYDESEEQLLYRVPVFDPFVCLPGSNNAMTTTTPTQMMKSSSHQNGYYPSDLDLEEFAADVETLLGKGLDEESYCIQDLGLLDDNNTNNNNNNNECPKDDLGKLVKEEDDDDDQLVVVNNGESEDVVIREAFEFNFDFDDDFPTTCEDQEMKMVESSMADGRGDELCKVEDGDVKENNNKEEILIIKRNNKILLRLDYDAISAAWGSQVSPWMNGQRPEISPEDCWPHCLGNCGTIMHHTLYGEQQQMGGIIGGGHGGGSGDGGREARVSRYREKRRTRLFSKKIRYEVRKLNAEKRPRMKGRFVKRSSFAPTSTPTSIPLLSKK